MLLLASQLVISERGVTANIPVLGTGDSGFESRRSDNIFFNDFQVCQGFSGLSRIFCATLFLFVTY